MQRVTREELRVLVAKLMGYTDISVFQVGREGRRMCTGKRPGQLLSSDVPDYPNEIAAAWQLVESLNPDTLQADIFRRLCDEGPMWDMNRREAATQICVNYLAAHQIMVEVIEDGGHLGT